MKPIKTYQNNLLFCKDINYFFLRNLFPAFSSSLLRFTINLSRFAPRLEFGSNGIKIGANMKVSVNKRNPNSKGLQQLRLVYYYGVVEGEDGKKRPKRDYEPLELYVYHNPKI